MCFSWGSRRDKYAYTDVWEREAESRPGRKLNPDWDPRRPYDYPKYYNERFDGDAAGASQRGGYQSIQGMQVRRPSHHAGGSTAANTRRGSEHAGGQNNPYGEGRSAAETSRRIEVGASMRRGASNSRRSDNNTSRRDGANTSRRSGADASRRNRNQGTGGLGAHSNIHTGRFSPDAVTRRPSPPPLRRRRR